MKKQLLKYSVIVLMTLCPSLLYAQQSSVIANYNDINQLEYNEEILRSVDLKLRFQVGIGIGQNRLEGSIKECHWKDYTMKPAPECRSQNPHNELACSHPYSAPIL